VESWQDERKGGKTVMDEREAGRVKRRKARLFWMRGKLAG
jgi:hypothetical protein